MLHQAGGDWNFSLFWLRWWENWFWLLVCASLCVSTCVCEFVVFLLFKLVAQRIFLGFLYYRGIAQKFQNSKLMFKMELEWSDVLIRIDLLELFFSLFLKNWFYFVWDLMTRTVVTEEFPFVVLFYSSSVFQECVKYVVGICEWASERVNMYVYM